MLERVDPVGDRHKKQDKPIGLSRFFSFIDGLVEQFRTVPPID